MARAHRTAWILAAASATALFGACSLNPQPIPPGDTDFSSGSASDGGPTNDNPGSGGGLTGSDAGKSDDAGVEPPPSDGGDAGDSGIRDAGDEDAADAGDI